MENVKNMKYLLKVFLALLILSSFSQAQTLSKKWQCLGFSMPESIVADDKYIYVSNVNADKKGFISRLSKSGKIDTLKWIKGLNNPAGLAVFDAKLYVGDGDTLHIIDTKTKSKKSIVSSQAKGLNDVAISKDGEVFISDIVSGKIFTLKKDKLEVFFQAKEIKHPNGLFVKDNHLYIANYATKLSMKLTSKEYGSVYKLNLSSKSYKQISSSFKLGGLDGLSSDGNKLLVSSNVTGELFAITDKQKILIGTFDKGLADISIQNDTLYMPFLFNNKIVAYSLKE